MDELRLPSALRNAKRVLIAGAGGGYDLYAGIPLYFALRREGKDAFFANLTFTYLGGTDAQMLTPSLARVEPTTAGPDTYFPERCLAQFLAERGEGSSIYAFEKTGVVPLRESYARLIEELSIDAIVLVDGGTDILMRGDEAGLGTPAEDMTSLAAVFAMDVVAVRLVVCVGFGVDAFHGVCHANFLENVAALSTDGAFLGTTSLLPSMAEARAYLDAVSHAEALAPRHPSIVNASIASAIEGRFGDYHRVDRTRPSTLFISPLMSMMWAFDLDSVARRSLYLHMLSETQTIWDVQSIIEAFRKNVKARPRSTIPH